jgi:hypothetical protein
MSDETSTSSTAPAPQPAPATSPAPAPAPAADDKRVPYDRFQSVVSARNDLAAQLEAARAEIQSLSERAATVDTVAQQAQEWQSKYQQAETRFRRFQAVASSAGVTDAETIELFEFRYGKLPPDDRPDFGEWVKAQASNPAEADPILRPFLPGNAPAPAPAPQHARPQPPVNGGAQQTPPAPAEVTPGMISQMSPEQYKAWKRRAKQRTAAGCS